MKTTNTAVPFLIGLALILQSCSQTSERVVVIPGGDHEQSLDANQELDEALDSSTPADTPASDIPAASDAEPRDETLDPANDSYDEPDLAQTEEPQDMPIDVEPGEPTDDLDDPIDTQPPEDEGEVSEDPCPPGMIAVEEFCISRWEAPNQEGVFPLVMFSYNDSTAWCQARSLRLCFDDEWQRACEGPEGNAYPYGNVHQPGVCNDDELWRTYNQTHLNGWPAAASASNVESFDDQLAIARSLGATAAADHVEWLYQGEAAGANPGCRGAEGVEDLCGNIEEWTRRRDGGTTSYRGALKGRYWAEARTCQSRVLSHGDSFRFYETGFRCCADQFVENGNW